MPTAAHARINQSLQLGFDAAAEGFRALSSLHLHRLPDVLRHLREGDGGGRRKRMGRRRKERNRVADGEGERDVSAVSVFWGRDWVLLSPGSRRIWVGVLFLVWSDESNLAGGGWVGQVM